MSKMQQVYISGALTNSGEKGFYDRLGKAVETFSWLKAYIPHHHTDPILHADKTPREIYETDNRIVRESSLLIICANNPSFGVGLEAEIANSAGIPILMLYRKGTAVSRMIRGVPSISKIIEYDTDDEAIEEVLSFLSSF